MLIIEETEDGVYQVTFQTMHKEWLDSLSKKLDMPAETVISFWLAAGMNALGSLLQA